MRGQIRFNSQVIKSARLRLLPWARLKTVTGPKQNCGSPQSCKGYVAIANAADKTTTIETIVRKWRGQG